MKQTFLVHLYILSTASATINYTNYYATIYCQSVLTSAQQTRIYFCEALFKLNYDILCQELGYVNPEVDCVSAITVPFGLIKSTV